MIKPSDTRAVLIPLVFACVLPVYGADLPAAADSAPAAKRIATLGPGDQIRVDVVDLPELSNRNTRVGADGAISLPHVGSLSAEGMTTIALEKAIEKRLSDFMYEPHAAVTVVEQASRPVYVLGAVHQPGALQMRGQMRLLEALSLAGGLTENSGHALTLTRRLERGALPLPGSRTDAENKQSIVEIAVEPLVSSEAPESNIELLPDDVISVTTADLVYVVGQVERAGGFVLKEKEGVTALKALALAGGLKPQASARKARILRRGAQGAEAEGTPVNLRAILDGKADDVALAADDVLFVPKSGAKTASSIAADTVLSTLSGILIWRR